MLEADLEMITLAARPAAKTRRAEYTEVDDGPRPIVSQGDAERLHAMVYRNREVAVVAFLPV